MQLVMEDSFEENFARFQTAVDVVIKEFVNARILPRFNAYASLDTLVINRSYLNGSAYQMSDRDPLLDADELARSVMQQETPDLFRVGISSCGQLLHYSSR